MKWLKRKDVAGKLGVSYNYLIGTLEKLEDFPKPIRMSPRMVVYEEGHVENWMRSQSLAVNENTSQ